MYTCYLKKTRIFIFENSAAEKKEASAAVAPRHESIPIQLCFHPFPTPKELELAGSLASGPISLLHICCVFGLSSGSPLCFVLSLSLFSMGKNFCLIYITRSGLCCSGEVWSDMTEGCLCSL